MTDFVNVKELLQSPTYAVGINNTYESRKKNSLNKDCQSQAIKKSKIIKINPRWLPKAGLDNKKGGNNNDRMP